MTEKFVNVSRIWNYKIKRGGHVAKITQYSKLETLRESMVRHFAEFQQNSEEDSEETRCNV